MKKKQSKKNLHAALRRQWHKDGTYEEAWVKQRFLCAICGRHPTPDRKLDCDHNHTTMKFRGLLCRNCNRRLAYWMKPDWLRKAADYLERNS